MNIHLLKVRCKNLQNFQDGVLEIDFISDKRVSTDEVQENQVSRLFNRIYKLNTLAFIGINASGKTTSINIVSSIISMYLGNLSVSSTMKISQYFSDYLDIETFYYDKESNCIYRLWSKVVKDIESNSLYFVDEVLSQKSVTGKTIKDNLYEFDDSQIMMERQNVANGFLKSEDSIFSSLMNKEVNKHEAILDMCNITQRNYLSAFNPNMVMSFIQYLDPSIEEFEWLSNTQTLPKVPKFRIRFKGSSKDIVVDFSELDQFLSSGTIKGISFFSNLFAVLINGSYMTIDEIENHFNKIIVANIIKMFTSKLNRNSATLIFSTHYSELLDSVSRSDSIYVLSKAEQMSIAKFSSVAGSMDRIDKKKSDVIFSGMLKTSPKYSAYAELIDAFNHNMGGKHA